MVEIRVLGKSQKEVEAWFRMVARLVQEQAGADDPSTGSGQALVQQRSVAEGREGDFLGYVRIRPPLLAGQIAAPRLPRKSRLPAGRRRRTGG